MEQTGRILEGFNLSTFSIIRAIGINTVVDILIIAYFIYVIMRWIRDTRAWSLFKGIIILLLVAAGASFFRLHTLSWIIRNAFSLGIITVIVIFQPEIRKALENLGKGKIRNYLFTAVELEKKELTDESIESIIQASIELSEQKTGALIAIMAEVGLGEMEDTGVTLDSAISKQMLMNIFVNKSPLHDGGVIIRENRIAAAACIFPLTQKEVDSKFGTRHRAAIGASEVSDAYVLVVSEETGKISIAKDGRLYCGLHEKEVRGMLTSGRKPAKRKLVLWKGRVNGDE